MRCQPVRTAPPVARQNTTLGWSREVSAQGPGARPRGRFRSSPPSRGRMRGGRFEGANRRDSASRAVAQGRQPGGPRPTCGSGRKRGYSYPMERKKKKDAMPLDPVRRRRLRLLTAKGSTLRTASVAMGRNDACLQQFIHRDTPKVLAKDDRGILAEHLGCRPELLKHGRSLRLSTHARRPPPTDAYFAPVGYSPVPEADVRIEPDAEAWDGRAAGDGRGVAVRRFVHPSPAPRRSRRPVDDRGGRGLDATAALGRRPHPDRREPDGARAAGGCS